MSSKENKGIFIAATNQHIGKTTTTLGLLAALRSRNINVGYCKPLGQEFVTQKGFQVDKDAALFADIMSYELSANAHSPIIMGRGYSEQYIQNPDNFQDNTQKILNAQKQLAQRHDTVVYEGTGHPGVGSVIDMSNADAAALLGMKVLLVVEGGIGNTIDRFNLCSKIFEQAGVPLAGIIINKVFPEKMDKVKSILGQYFAKQNVEIFGFLPYIPELSSPTIDNVWHELGDQILSGGEAQKNNIIEDIITNSTIDMDLLKNYEKKCLLIVSNRKLTNVLTKLREIWTSEQIETNLSGVVITGIDRVSSEQLHFLQDHNVPVIQTHYDTIDSGIKISHLKVKLNARTPLKIKTAIELFQKHINVDRLCEIMGV